MAAASVSISNMGDAIYSGVVPGDFTPDRKTYEFPVQLYDGARGSKHSWQIYVALLNDADKEVAISDEMLVQPAPPIKGHRARIMVTSLQIDGKVRVVAPTYVLAGKNLGKKNATNCITQGIRDALGLHNKQSKRTNSTNDAADRPPPMLVKSINSDIGSTFTQMDFDNGVTVQRKLNGVHFMAYFNGTRVVCYSRSSTIYPEPPHISAELIAMFNAMPVINPGEYGTPNDGTYDGAIPYLDGELYEHGKELREISGQARKSTKCAESLEFHVFDVMFPLAKSRGHDMASRDRQDYIDTFFSNIQVPHIRRVENIEVQSEATIHELHDAFIADGYEGAIARRDDAGYRYSHNGYHSNNLVKIKPVFSDEFIVSGYFQGTKGKDVGCVIWECMVSSPIDPNDATFTVVPNMPYTQRAAIFAAFSADPALFERDFKGQPLTVEYRDTSSKTGKPQQGKAIAFRTYESGPHLDPVQKLLSACA
jgi:hypothetical protein